QPDVTAVAAVTTVGPALRHEGFAPERNGAGTAVATTDVEVALVDERGHAARLGLPPQCPDGTGRSTLKNLHPSADAPTVRGRRSAAPTRARGCSARSRRSRGAVIVEAAIIMPVLVTVILGIIEFGYAFHTRLTIKNMSLVGARAGSGLASEVYSDYSILQAVERATSGLQRDRIETIVVYRATGPNDRVPEACKTSSVPNSEHTR